jgi:branched-chain amino acid transport system permease protein
MSQPSKAGFFLTILALAVIGPFVGSDYFLHVLVLCFIWTIVVAAWDLSIGYAGIFNFAQLALFAVGSYTSAMLSMNLGVPTIVAILLAVCVTAFAGMLVALPCLRLKGEYVALFTFSVHLALPTLLEKGRGFGTGGATGLIGVPPIDFVGAVLRTNDKLAWYYVALGLAALTVWIIYFYIASAKWGRAFVALRDAEAFARSLGVDEQKAKLVLFTISAAVTGLGGALYAHYIGVITPRVLGNEFFLLLMVMLSLGGMGVYPGAILGVFFITIGNEVLREIGQYRLLVLGVIVVLAAIWLPRGLGELLNRTIYIQWARRHGSSVER